MLSTQAGPSGVRFAHISSTFICDVGDTCRRDEISFSNPGDRVNKHVSVIAHLTKPVDFERLVDIVARSEGQAV